MALTYPYINIKGVWHYLYRAVDTQGDTIDFMLSKNRDEASAKAFFTKAIRSNGFPEKITIDKSGANKAGINAINLQLKNIENLVIKFSLENPHLGQAQVSLQLNKIYHTAISPSGVRNVWVRAKLQTMALRVHKQAET